MKKMISHDKISRRLGVPIIHRVETRLKNEIPQRFVIAARKDFSMMRSLSVRNDGAIRSSRWKERTTSCEAKQTFLDYIIRS